MGATTICWKYSMVPMVDSNPLKTLNIKEDETTYTGGSQSGVSATVRFVHVQFALNVILIIVTTDVGFTSLVFLRPERPRQPSNSFWFSNIRTWGISRPVIEAHLQGKFFNDQLLEECETSSPLVSWNHWQRIKPIAGLFPASKSNGILGHWHWQWARDHRRAFRTVVRKKLDKIFRPPLIMLTVGDWGSGRRRR